MVSVTRPRAERAFYRCTFARARTHGSSLVGPLPDSDQTLHRSETTEHRRFRPVVFSPSGALSSSSVSGHPCSRINRLQDSTVALKRGRCSVFASFRDAHPNSAFHTGSRVSSTRLDIAWDAVRGS